MWFLAVVGESSNSEVINTEKDSMRQNVQAIERKTHNKDNMRDPTLAPPGYQRGVIPKYLTDRKEANQRRIVDKSDCPEGHVLLDEEERRETLKIFQQRK